MRKKTTIIGTAAVIFAVTMLAITAFAGKPADKKTYMANSTTAQCEINNHLSDETIINISKPCGAVAAREPDPNFHTS